MADAMESAVALLIKAQREAEEIYINSPETEVRWFPAVHTAQEPQEPEGESAKQQGPDGVLRRRGRILCE